MLDFECTLTNTLISMTTSLTIQQAASVTGLTVHTLRYYEQIGLIDPIHRKDNKHRLYREKDIEWIEFLLKLRSTGLPIQKMLRYAELRRLGNQRESVAERKASFVKIGIIRALCLHSRHSPRAANEIADIDIPRKWTPRDGQQSPHPPPFMLPASSHHFTTDKWGSSPREWGTRVCPPLDQRK